jgi:hypothetical protein
MGLGGLARQLWHEPRVRLRNMILEGGPYEQWRTANGHKDMHAAALALPTLSEPNGSPYPTAIRFLSGARFWHQTLLCMVSLQLQSERRIDAIVFDDGTLDADACAAVLRVMPWTRFVMAEEIDAQIEERLPASHFPTLRARRAVYPHLRKLTDLHDANAWSLIFDSDMLFYRKPTALLNWMEAPKNVIFIEDFMRSYGYSESLMNELARGTVPDRMNVGLYGIHGSHIDYEYLEYCARVTIDRERASYFQEQALTALLVSGMNGVALPAKDYIVLPTLSEGKNQRAVMHHYVAHSKRSYFQYGWRRVVAQLENANAGSNSRT